MSVAVERLWRDRSPKRILAETKSLFLVQKHSNERDVYLQCPACRHQCSPIAGTVFESTKLALTQSFVAMDLLTQSKRLY